jgi:DNA ligase-1
MKTVIQILEDLESVSGRLAKEEILELNIKNKLLKRALVLACDANVPFYVNKFKMPKPGKGAGGDAALESFLNTIVDKLASRKVTGNAAKDLVDSLFSKMNESEQKWCQRILLKNLRCGVSDSTINKAWPGSIVGFAVQLAETLKSSCVNGKITILDEVEYPVHVDPKLDGLRCIAVKRSGRVTMFTRNGTVLETLPRIAGVLEGLEYDDFVLDGEALGEDWNESASVVMSSKSKKDDSGMKYHVFDGMSLEEWDAQQGEMTYAERLEYVASILDSLPKGSPVVPVVGKIVKSEKELMKFYSETMDKGYEGIMIKDPSALYRWKRTDAVQKLKPIQTFEGVVVGHNEGRRGSKREGLWGGFNVVLPNGVVTKLGGGFSDKLKAEIDMDPDVWIGRIVEMEGQPDPMTEDGLSADGKVRFPVFSRVRDASDVDPKVVKAGKKYLAEHKA